MEESLLFHDNSVMDLWCLMMMTPKTKITAPTAMIVPTESESLTEFNEVMSVVCVVLQKTDDAITDVAVTANMRSNVLRNSSGAC